MPSKLPEIGKFYDCYDDGKIHYSRKYLVRITNIVPFSEISSEILKKWEEYKEGYDWLFAKETDYFIIADSYEKGEFCLSESIFVRTNDGGQWDTYEEALEAGIQKAIELI